MKSFKNKNRKSISYSYPNSVQIRFKQLILFSKKVFAEEEIQKFAKDEDEWTVRN